MTETHLYMNKSILNILVDGKYNVKIQLNKLPQSSKEISPAKEVAAMHNKIKGS
jgi:hypothetical protein